MVKVKLSWNIKIECNIYKIYYKTLMGILLQSDQTFNSA